MFRRTLVVIALLAVATAAPAADKLPADLALVPGNAVAFVHVKLADVWKADTFKEARDLLEKAGPKAFAALDDQFVPAPSSVARGTVVVLQGEQKEAGPVVAVILAFSKPFDLAAVKKANMPKAVEKKANGKAYVVDEGNGLAVHFADDSTLVVSTPAGMPEFLAESGRANGPMRGAVLQAVNEQAIASVTNIDQLPLPPQLFEGWSDEQKEVLKVERLTLTMTFAAEVTFALSATYSGAADAAEAEKVIRAATAGMRKALEPMKAEAEKAVFGAEGKGKDVRPLAELPSAAGGLATLAWVNWVDGMLADPPVKAKGDTVTAKVTLPSWAGSYMGTMLVTLLPAVQKVREAAGRMTSMNNLKQLALAAHNYESANGTFPAAAICDAKGKKLLSWRVAVLPYIEQEELYKQFKLDEPWDSDHNKKLIPLMPKTFADPRVAAKPGETFYKVFVHLNAGFDWEKGQQITSITDGTSNTIMIAAGGDPVTWTKPDDFEFDPLDADTKLPDLTKPFGALLVAMFDGSVRSLDLKTMKDADRRLRAAITRAGGEVVSLDDD
jgi:hypothetical protein